MTKERHSRQILLNYAHLNNFMPGKMWILSRQDWISAEHLPSAVLTLESSPDGVELVNGGFDQGGFIGQDSCLKVSGPSALHSYPSSSQIGRTDIGSLTIKDDYLEVDTRTKGTLQAGKEDRVVVKVFPEVRPRFLGVNQANLLALLDQVGQDSQERTVFIIEVLDISRSDPKRTFHLGHPGNHLLEMGFV